MWYPAKAAFRAGRVGDDKDGTQWDAAKVGDYSAAFGVDTKASGFVATAMGDETTASGFADTAMGSNTTASGGQATAMGNETIASGGHATAMGNGTTASGLNATAMGNGTTADTDNSLSLGECNSINTTNDGTLLAVGNGSYDFNSDDCSSTSDVLVLDQNGDLSIDGVFNDELSTYAGHFQTSESGSDKSGHAVLVENAGGDGSDGLAIQTGSISGPPDVLDNFVTFYDGDGNGVGSIEGNGSGGIDYTSGGADFAEELPVAQDAEPPAPAEIVGVRGGTASLNTDAADRVMIASTAPIMTGNAEPGPKAEKGRRVAVAFVGQVPAKVRGTAEPGDLIVASGEDDGTARAVDPADYRRSEHGPIAGQAWSAKPAEEIGEVTVAVGLGRSGAVAEQLAKQRTTNQKQQAQIEDLKTRLAALEAERAPSTLAGLTGSGTGLLLAFLLGGLFGAGLFFRRRS
jgi:hypothetical protein